MSSLLKQQFDLITPTNVFYTALVLIVVAAINQFVYKPSKLSYKNLPGPSSWNPIFGALGPIIKEPPGEAHARWLEKYGSTIRYAGFFHEPRFFTTDPTALQYMLNHGDLFPKGDATRKSLADILGKGILFAEGDDHRRQKRIMNPSFAPSQIREAHTPIFLTKAYELRDVFSRLISESDTSSLSPSGQAHPNNPIIEVYSYIGKCTLDVIGLAGFGYDFGSLARADEELAMAFGKMFSMTAGGLSMLQILMTLTPGLRSIPTARKRAIDSSLATMKRIGNQLIQEKKEAAIAANGGTLEKGVSPGRDLLSVIVRANMDPTLKDSQRMTDEETLGQIQTFMLAGQETSSTALTWTLYMLSKNQEMQTKLREECRGVLEEMPGMDQLNALEYLDAVVHESLRVLAPVPNTRRDSAEDAVVPLGKPVRGRDGKMVSEVRLPKGTVVMLPIINVNTSTAVWGEDALEFKPERWTNPQFDGKAYKETIPSVWGNVATFISGPRACIGYRFALVEIKAILFVLIRNFQFDEVLPRLEIEKKTSLVTRPHVKGDTNKKSQMPLRVSVAV